MKGIQERIKGINEADTPEQSLMKDKKIFQQMLKILGNAKSTFNLIANLEKQLSDDAWDLYSGRVRTEVGAANSALDKSIKSLAKIKI